jgi:cytochrome b
MLMKIPFLANKRLLGALVCYAVLALIAALVLDGILRGAVLCLFAILTIKTLVHGCKDEKMP